MHFQQMQPHDLVHQQHPQQQQQQQQQGPPPGGQAPSQLNLLQQQHLLKQRTMHFQHILTGSRDLKTNPNLAPAA
ncbi:hypothetical protein DIPPA_14690 [Diplonema papillatum]|nr:hypothetical protein DIPPA_14690 [Diplonema papillatum]